MHLGFLVLTHGAVTPRHELAMATPNYLEVVQESRRLRNALPRDPLPQLSVPGTHAYAPKPPDQALPSVLHGHLHATLTLGLASDRRHGEPAGGDADTASGAGGQPGTPGDPLALVSSPIGEPGTPPTAPASEPGPGPRLLADLSAFTLPDFVTEVPAQPVTPPGSPPRTMTGASAYQEVVQELLDAPPVEKHVGNVRGPQGYEWERDTDVQTKYTPRNPSTPRAPFKPWEPPPIVELGAELSVPAPSVTVGAGIPHGGGRPGEKHAHDIALPNFFSSAQEADIPYSKCLEQERVQLRGLHCVFWFERGKYVVSALLRGGQLAQR